MEHHCCSNGHCLEGCALTASSQCFLGALFAWASAICALIRPSLLARGISLRKVPGKVAILHHKLLLFLLACAQRSAQCLVLLARVLRCSGCAYLAFASRRAWVCVLHPETYVRDERQRGAFRQRVERRCKTQNAPSTPAGSEGRSRGKK